MLQSLSEFKFFRSFRVPIDNGDGVVFSLRVENSFGQYDLLDGCSFIDASLTGIGIKSTHSFSIGENIEVNINYKRVQIECTGKVVRSFGSESNEIIYGIEIDEDDHTKMKRFLSLYIMGQSQDRIRNLLSNIVLEDDYVNIEDSFEMYSLFNSLFNDIQRYSRKDGFLDDFLAEVTRSFEAQKSAVFLINPDSNELEAVSSVAIDKDLLKFDYREGIIGTVFTTGVTLNIDAQEDHLRSNKPIDEKLDYQTNSIICSPLKNGEDKVIGVIQFINKKTANRFSEFDEKNIRIVCSLFSSFFHDFAPMSERSLIRRFSAHYDREYALIGKSSYVSELRRSIVALKDIDNHLVIQGEAGVGKKLFAKIIHNEGKRGSYNFSIISCTKSHQEDIENALFGHDGIKSKFEDCYHGTVIIEDIDRLSLKAQKRLAEVFLSQEIAEQLPLNSRIIGTSRQNLETLVKNGEFYKPLYRFLSSGVVKMSPLRKHKEDIPMLIEYFMKKECQKQGMLLKYFTDELMEDFMNHDWMGNITELKQVIDKSVLFNPKSHIIKKLSGAVLSIFNKSDHSISLLNDIPLAANSELPLKERISLVEREIILLEIKKLGGNKSRAAKAMGISREALRKKLINSDRIIKTLSKDIDTDKEAA